MATTRIDRESQLLVVDERGLERVGMILCEIEDLRGRLGKLTLAFHEDSAHYAKLQEVLTHLSEVDESLYEAKVHREAYNERLAGVMKHA